MLCLIKAPTKRKTCVVVDVDGKEKTVVADQSAIRRMSGCVRFIGLINEQGTVAYVEYPVEKQGLNLKNN